MKIPLIVFFWLLFWLILSNFSIGGIITISYKTNFIVLIGLLGFLLGIFFASSNYVSKKLYIINQNKILFKLERYYKFFLPISFILILFLFIKFLIIIINDPLSVTRLALFGNDEAPSIVFGSQQILLVYTIFFKTILKILVVFGFVLSFLKKKSIYFILANLLWLLDSLIFLGRGALLEFIYQIIFFYLLCSILKLKFSNRVKKILYSSIIFLILLAPIISIVRGDEDGMNLKNFFYTQVINYHTVGYVIFDQEINNSNSRINNVTTYGRASLGGIERLIVLIIRRFNKDVDSASGQNGEYLNEFRLLGKNQEGNELYYNAFCTLFYTFYLDGGILLVFFGFLLYSYFLTKSSLLVSRNNYNYLPILYVLFQFGLNSLYGSPLENTIYWYVIISLFLIQNLPKIKMFK